MRPRVQGVNCFLYLLFLLQRKSTLIIEYNSALSDMVTFLKVIIYQLISGNPLVWLMDEPPH